MNIRNNIPNFITLLNLISGTISIIMAFSGELILASWFVIIAAVFDFLDGMVARLLHARSDIGAQLDSLADVVSFGVAPSIIMYFLLLNSPGLPSFQGGEFEILPFASLLIAVAGAYRLAKFNTDPQQESEFKGLPIPANGIFVASLPLIIEQYANNEAVISIISNYYFLLALIIILSLLMVSNIPMLSLKFKNYAWKSNSWRYVLIVCALAFFAFFRFSAVPMTIFLYIIISILSPALKHAD